MSSKIASSPSFSFPVKKRVTPSIQSAIDNQNPGPLTYDPTHDKHIIGSSMFGFNVQDRFR
jgi:hypothetical protein